MILADLGETTTVATAAKALSISRAQAYRLIKADRFPCPILRIGDHRISVPTAGLRAFIEEGAA